MELRDAAGHVVVGGGVLGLSAAWRLAERGADVLVLDKGRIGGGASGAAGGIVRNYYRAPAITDVVRLSVEMFEADPEAFGFRQVGYLAAVPAAQVDDLVAINGRHRECGYESELVLGEGPCSEYLAWTWPDWEAPVAALLHERRGGWADPMRTVRRLAELARAAGAEIAEGVEVTEIERGEGGVEALTTSHGRVRCERVVFAPGPWAAGVLGMLGGTWPAISYWKAQEGEFELRQAVAGARAGHEPPVVHLDHAGPLRSDADGRLLVDGPWGIYFRVGAGGATVTGGGLPVPLVAPELDPYGPDNPEHAAGPAFADFFISGLAATIRRFRGRAGDWRTTLAGGIVSHTPDNYPICDWVAPNAYAIVDSGHGFKLLALGRLAADEFLGAEPTLEPFRLSRFERGETHPASKGPYPWT